VTYIIKPNATRALSKLLKFLCNLSSLYNTIACPAIAYLYQLKTLMIKYSKQNIGSQAFTGASDTTFKDDLISRHSTKGYLFTLFGGVIN